MIGPNENMGLKFFFSLFLGLMPLLSLLLPMFKTRLSLGSHPVMGLVTKFQQLRQVDFERYPELKRTYQQIIELVEKTPH